MKRFWWSKEQYDMMNRLVSPLPFKSEPNQVWFEGRWHNYSSIQKVKPTFKDTEHVATMNEPGSEIRIRVNGIENTLS